MTTKGSRKSLSARLKLDGQSPRLGKSKTILITFLLWIVNVIVIFPLFFGEYTQFSGSIEPAFLTDARFI
ncbi:MAG: hypothetical protein ACRECH_16705, partial [Nitrososphaerales archaeon]